ncbi:MAG: hypothetical protein QXX94_04695 [Candidatus Bathyarchaeia archaeon]
MFRRRRKKGQTSLEVLALLLVALAITGVSAAVYNLFRMEFSPVTVETAKVQFKLGADSNAAGASIGVNGTYVSFNSISGWPNATRIYEDIIRIRNFDSSSRVIKLEFDSWSGDTSAIDYIYVKVFAGNTQMGNTITIGSQYSSTGDLTIPAGAEWRVQWEIKWKADAQSTQSVSVALKLIVQGE